MTIDNKRGHRKRTPRLRHGILDSVKSHAMPRGAATRHRLDYFGALELVKNADLMAMEAN
jgi:hypothetical protein